MLVNVKVLDNSLGLEMMSYATDGSAGMDLRAAVKDKVTLKPFERLAIPTGVAIEIPEFYNGEVRSRSGLALKFGIIVLNSPGTVDSDYRGEIHVLLYNAGDQEFVVERGMRIAQLVIARYEKIELNVVENLGDTVRASGGYGSTGIL